MNLEQNITEFIDCIEEGEIEIYNEFSLQHELGIFLRARLVGYKIQFERNTKFFGIEGTVKHEIDIVIYNEKEKHAIELKYPRNGQYSEQMFSFIKDICFMEELKEVGFDSTYCLTIVQDKNFYSGSKEEGIYGYFRGQDTVRGMIAKPTGKKDENYIIKGNYKIEWMSCSDFRYYVVKICL